MDNKQDLEDYLVSFRNQVPRISSEPKYERNPVLNPQQNLSTNKMAQMHPQPIRPQPDQQEPAYQQQIPPPPGSMGTRNGTFDVSSPAGQPGPDQNWNPSAMPPSMPAAQRSAVQPGHDRSFSHGALLNQASTSQPPFNPRNSASAVPPSHQRYGNGASLGGSIGQAGPPQLGALPFQQSQSSMRESSPPPQGGLNASAVGQPDQQPVSARSVSPPSTVTGPTAPSTFKPKQVFGLSLSQLYERDGLAVPMVVYQCIQAVDLYGLAVEGIYRLSGSTTHVQKLKSMFDTGEIPSRPVTGV